MKKIYSLLALLPALVFSQTPSVGKNYTKTTLYKIPSLTLLASPSPDQATVSLTYFDGLGRAVQGIAHAQSATGGDIVTPIVYDGFGRQPRQYLPYPSGSSSLAYQDNAALIGSLEGYYAATYGAQGANPYSEKVLEASPLGSVLKQGAPGTPWAVNPTGSDHTIKFDYQANEGPTSTAKVKMYRITSTYNAATQAYDNEVFTLNGTTYYPAGQLYRTVTKNENWTSGTNNTTEEYKDKEGKLILKRTFGVSVVNDAETSSPHETYYVYDQFGNLCAVLPPMSAGVGLTSSNNLCYRYWHDSRNRVVEKKLPGKNREFIVYDKMDRVVAAGPNQSPFPGGTGLGWLLTRYDASSRVAFTGWYPITGGGFTASKRYTLQAANNGAVTVVEPGTSTVDGIAIKYAPTALPTGFKLLTVNYYDDYRFLPVAMALPADVEGAGYITASTAVSTKGLQTGSWIRVLTGVSEIPGETSYTLYDTKSRPIRNYMQNHLGGYHCTDSKLRFTGLADYTLTRHKQASTGTELTTKDAFTYTGQDRLLGHTHEIVGVRAPELMSLNEYYPLGELKNKKVGGLDTSAALFHQSVDYTYNIRGWLTGINNVADLTEPGMPDDLFAFGIGYEAPAPVSGVVPLYNGNISETLWKTASDNNLRQYSYAYDTMDRLRKATYQKNGSITGSYNEQARYDKNGNIRGMVRTGFQDDPVEALEIDDLDYAYMPTSNYLQSVSDASLSPRGFMDDTVGSATDYTYDVYGNMLSDVNKGITQITYNHLHLPIKIVFGSEDKKIEYLYDAVGTKVRKTVYSLWRSAPVIDVVDYQQGFQYLNNRLQLFPTAEGYVDCTHTVSSTAYNYVYQYKDHLGNTRLSYGTDAVGAVRIMQEQHYYPFGLQHENYNVETMAFRADENDLVALRDLFDPEPEPEELVKLPYNYKFQGQELQDELGLNVYDYENRTYDPATGRWWQMDPMAEKGRRWSPYTYAMNNPVYFIDPDGMWPENPFSGMISKAKSFVGAAVNKAVRNVAMAVAGKVSSAMTKTAAKILTSLTPDISNPFTKSAPDKADRTSSNGLNLQTDGGKEGAMATPITTGNVKQVDVEAVMMGTDIIGPETTIPGVAPDGSNPLASNDKPGTIPSMDTSTVPDDEMVRTKTEGYHTAGPVGPNGSGANAQVIKTSSDDTIVKRSDVQKVRNQNLKRYHKEKTNADSQN